MGAANRNRTPTHLAVLAVLVGALAAAIAAISQDGSLEPKLAWWVIGGGAALAFGLSAVGVAITKRAKGIESQAATLASSVVPFPPDASKMRAEVGQAAAFALLPELEVVKVVQGRTKELNTLLAWCMDEKSPRVAVISGPPLVGKTRLAMELATEARKQNWAVVAPRPRCEERAVGAVIQAPSPHLLVVDLRSSGAELKPIFTAMAGGDSASSWKLLLVAASRAALHAQADSASDFASALIDSALEIELAASGSKNDLARWASAARSDFAEFLNLADIQVTTHSAPGTSFPEGIPIGAMHAEILADLTYSGPDNDRPLNLEAALNYLAERELRHLSRDAEGVMTEPLLARALSVTWLVGDGDAQALTRVLRRIPELSDASTERISTIANWTLSATGGSASPMSASASTTALAVRRLRDDPQLRKALSGSLRADSLFAAIGRLTHAVSLVPSAEEVLAELIGDVGQQEGASGAPYIAVANADARSDELVASVLKSSAIDPIEVRRLKHWAAKSAFKERVVLTLSLLDADNVAAGAISGDLQDHLLEVATRHMALSERSQAIAVLDRLATVESSAGYDPVGEGVVKHLLLRSQALLELDEERAAESFAYARELCDQGGNRLGSAIAQIGLARAQIRRNDWRNADAASDAVQRFETQGRPVRPSERLFESPLSELVLYLTGAELLFETGQYLEAAIQATKAEKAARDLLPSDRSMHFVAAALVTHSASLHRLNECVQAMPKAVEAASLRRALFSYQPQAHAVALADALINLAAIQGDLGQAADSQRAAAEAAQILRQRTKSDGAMLDMKLARAVESLGTSLHVAGKHSAALKYLLEAQSIISEAVRKSANPSPEVKLREGNAHLNLGATLSNSGDPQAAVPLLSHAVRVFEALAQNFHIDQDALGMAYFNLGVTHERLHDIKAARTHFLRAVEVYSDLAASNSAGFGSLLANAQRALRNLPNSQ